MLVGYALAEANLPMNVEPIPDIIMAAREAAARRQFADAARLMSRRAAVTDTGAQAYALFRRFSIDVVVCERSLPDFDGVELLDMMLRRESRTRIILVGTEWGPADVRAAFLRGAFDVLPGDVDVERVMESVRRALECGSGDSRSGRPRFVPIRPVECALSKTLRIDERLGSLDAPARAAHVRHSSPSARLIRRQCARSAAAVPMQT